MNLKSAAVGILFVSTLSFTATSATKVVAHRGFWNTDNSAQNSLVSFHKADSIGCYGSEIDVWLTTDDHLVVNHDRIFQGLFMETASFEELRALRLPNGEQIPTDRKSVVGG